MRKKTFLIMTFVLLIFFINSKSSFSSSFLQPKGFYYHKQYSNKIPKRVGNIWQQTQQVYALGTLFNWYIFNSLGLDDFSGLEKSLEKLDYSILLPNEHLTIHKINNKLLNTDSEIVFNYFVNNAQEVFNSAGLYLLPYYKGSLKIGQRLAIEYKDYPGFYSPVEIQINEAEKTIYFITLDGHFFRGFNSFKFIDDKKGNVDVEQEMFFQGSSFITDLGIMFGDSVNLQNNNWLYINNFLYNKVQKKLKN